MAYTPDPGPFMAVILEAVKALDEELDPGALRELAETLVLVDPALAAALSGRAARAERIRALIARALAGDLFEDGC